MKSPSSKKGLQGFTLIELVVVMVILSTMTVMAYAPLRDGISTIRTTQACAVVESQFGVTFDRVKMEFRQAGTVLNVQPGDMSVSASKWVTYQTLNGDISLLYFDPNTTSESGGDLYTYTFPTTGADPSGVAAHNVFVTAVLGGTFNLNTLVSAGASRYTEKLESFGLSLYAMDDAGNSATTTNIALADYLRVQAKPRSQSCQNLAPWAVDVGVKSQGAEGKALVISEVMYETANDDFVEITNATSASVDLNGFVLTYEGLAGNLSHTFAARVLEPGERVIVTGIGASITPVRRQYPTALSTHSPLNSGTWVNDLSGSGEVRLRDPSNVTVSASNCPEIGADCEDIVRYGSFLYDDFNWGDTLSTRVADGVADTRGWEYSTSVGTITASQILGLTQRRLTENILSTSQTISSYTFLPSQDADGAASGGVLASFEVSGSKIMGENFYVTNARQLTVTSNTDVIISFKNLRQYDLLAGGGDRVFNVEYCNIANGCGGVGQEADPDWIAITAGLNVDTSQSPNQETKATVYDSVTATQTLVPGTYKFRIRFKTPTNYNS